MNNVLYRKGQFYVLQNSKSKKFFVAHSSKIMIPFYLDELGGFAIFENYVRACGWADILNGRVEKLGTPFVKVV